MHWILEYQLFLFDLDGLLVNTEEIHYQAYKSMLKNRGYDLTWDFMTYFGIAQKDAEAPKRYIYAEFPALEREEPNWEVLYAEKKETYLQLLQTESAPLLPGVEPFLLALQKENIKRCVVTHSARLFVDQLIKKNPVLATIPHWITREDYEQPKPAPDGYLKAIQTYAQAADRVIGFEDSSRGLRSLLATRATPILINAIDENLRDSFAKQGVRTFRSFEEVTI